MTINFLDQKKNGRLLTVPEILMKGGGRIPPPTKMNSRVKLCLVVVTFVWAGCMQNFRPLGYSPGWGGWGGWVGGVGLTVII